MQIQTTNDYKKFKIITGNRPLNRNNLLKITKSIAQKNMLEVAPIIVNEEFEIVDGQHRFQIAKENKYPIHYVVLKGGDLTAVHMLNNISRKWNAEDYIKSYAMQGNLNYRRFLTFMQDTDIPTQIVGYLLLNHSGGSLFKLIREGNLVVTDEDIDKGHLLNQKYQAIRSHYEGTTGRQENLIKAILILNKAGLAETLISKLDSRELKLEHVIGTIAYLRQFEEVLNWKKKGEENLIRLF